MPSLPALDACSLFFHCYERFLISPTLSTSTIARTLWTCISKKKKKHTSEITYGFYPFCELIRIIHSFSMTHLLSKHLSHHFLVQGYRERKNSSERLTQKFTAFVLLNLQYGTHVLSAHPLYGHNA